MAVINARDTAHVTPLGRKEGARRLLRSGSAPTFVLLGLIGFYLAQPGSYQLYLVTTMLVYYIVGLGLDVIFGYAGQISIGSAGFFAVGAYIGTLLARAGGDSVLVLPAVLMIGAFVGAALGFIAQRLRGFGFAIVTWGFAIVIQTLILALPEITGGQLGLAVPKPKFLGSLLVDPGAMYAMCGVFAVLFTVANVAIAKSRVGRSLLAIRTNEVMAKAVGIRPAPHKIGALAYAGATAALAGMLFAYNSSYLAASAFDPALSVTFLALVVVGGVRSVAGVVLGTFIVVWLPSQLQATAELSVIIFGLALIVALIISEEGLIGAARNAWRLLRKRTLGSSSIKSGGRDVLS